MACKNYELGIKKIRQLMIESQIKKQTELYIDTIFNRANSLLKTININIKEMLYFTDIIAKRSN